MKSTRKPDEPESTSLGRSREFDPIVQNKANWLGRSSKENYCVKTLAWA
jgi:hypothetical protein